MMVLREAGTTPLPVEIDPDLEDQVEAFLQIMHQSFTAKAGESVILICAHLITLAVLASLPGSALTWLFNDVPLLMDPSRLLYNKGDIHITDLTPADTGVYTCSVLWGSEKAKRNITVGVYSVEVTADSTTRFVFEGDSMKLTCNSQPLGRLFPAATRQWFHNDTIVSVPGPTASTNESVDLIPCVTKSMFGVWECRVKDNTTRIWKTAWYNVTIDDAPSFISRIYAAMVYHMDIAIIVTVSLLVVLCVCFGCCVYKMKTVEDQTDEKFLNTRNGWEETFSKFGVEGKVRISDKDLPSKQEADEDDGEPDESSFDESSFDESSFDESIESGNLDQTTNRTKEIFSNDDVKNSNKSSSNLLRKQTKKEKLKRKNRKKIKNNIEKPENIQISNKIGHEIRRNKVQKGIFEAEKLAKCKHSLYGIKKKNKQRVIYPEMKEEFAYKWLLNNSTNLAKFAKVLKNKENKSRLILSSKMIVVPCQDSRHTPIPMDSRLFKLSPSATSSKTKQSRSCSRKLQASDSNVNKRNNSSKDNYKRAQTPETVAKTVAGNSEDIRSSKDKKMMQNKEANNNIAPKVSKILQSRPSEGEQIKQKSWASRVINRLSRRKRKPPTGDHSNVRYYVLPQADDSEFL